MRMRALPYLAVGLVSWFLVWRFLESLRPFDLDYEFGSVAFPMPAYIRLLILGGLVSTAVGIPMLVIDFIRWTRKSEP